MAMRAVVIDEISPVRRLSVEHVPEPMAGEHDLLIAVRAAAVNRADLRRAASHFAASDSHALPIAGVEFAGEVTAVGASVEGFSVGDRVMAMGGAAFAECTTIDHRLAIPVPVSMSWEVAAATPVSFITAHDAMVSVGRLVAGEIVLVQGASTGAGIAAVQIAKLYGAKTIFGTAGSLEKLERLRALGCGVPINYRHDDILKIIRSQSDGAEVTIDFSGGETLRKSVEAAAIRGRIVCAGRVAGSDATFNLDEFSRKQLHMSGVTNRTRSLEERIQTVRAFIDDLMPALTDGTIGPIIDRIYPLEEAASAQEYMRSNMHFGKIVLTV